MSFVLNDVVSCAQLIIFMKREKGRKRYTSCALLPIHLPTSFHLQVCGAGVTIINIVLCIH